MSKMLYTVRDLFSGDSLNGCLGMNEAVGYYIAPYQRGYKWQSSTDWSSPDQVNTLLRDIYDAWKRNPKSTYYLQFITVKRVVRGNNDPKQNRLEVIDGQQRLTTLSILSAVLKQKYPPLGDFSGNTIEYYNAIKCLSCFHTDSPEEIKKITVTGQTIWFMTQAYQNISSLLGIKFGDNGDDINSFYDYLCNNTLVIVNLVYENIKGEEVFENLNGRKIPLTDSELIKGLLLCQAARHSTRMSYNEVLERRADMGRTWDEMERWLLKPEVGPFFFGDGQVPVYVFLLLIIMGYNNSEQHQGLTQEHLNNKFTELYIARQEQSSSQTKRYRLFNEYYSRIATPEDALVFFRTIEDWYWRLRDAFEDVARHNAFGFLLFRQKGVNRLKLIGTLINSGHDWQSEVKRKICEMYKKANTETGMDSFCKNYLYRYGGDSSEDIRRDLLLLNCFVVDEKEGFRPNNKLAFPFYDLDDRPMNSLEHVQCQNPLGINEKGDETPDQLAEDIGKRTDIFNVLFLIRDARRICQFKDIYKEEAEKLGKIIKDYASVVRNADEFESGRPWNDFCDEDKRSIAALYLQLIEIHYDMFWDPLSKLRPVIFSGVDIQCLHSIGNLVLVTGALNTAFSNRTFRAKREILRDKVNEGATVPPQTFNVFSKMGGIGSHADCWCAEDAAENAYETLKQLFNLLEALHRG